MTFDNAFHSKLLLLFLTRKIIVCQGAKQVGRQYRGGQPELGDS